MDIDIDTAIGLAKTTKEGMDWADMEIPMLHLQCPGGDAVFMLDLTGYALYEAIRRACKDHPTCTNAIFIADARMRRFVDKEDATSNHDLQAEWMAGRRDGIVECLMVMVVQRGGAYEVRQVIYDPEARTWEEATEGEGDPGGGVFDAMIDGMSH